MQLAAIMQESENCKTGDLDCRQGCTCGLFEPVTNDRGRDNGFEASSDVGAMMGQMMAVAFSKLAPRCTSKHGPCWYRRGVHGSNLELLLSGKYVLSRTICERDALRRGDVTGGYAADWTVEQLREPAQKIADHSDILMVGSGAEAAYEAGRPRNIGTGTHPADNRENIFWDWGGGGDLMCCSALGIGTCWRAKSLIRWGSGQSCLCAEHSNAPLPCAYRY